MKMQLAVELDDAGRDEFYRWVEAVASAVNPGQPELTPGPAVPLGAAPDHPWRRPPRPRGIGLKVTEQGIDTTTVEGRAMFGMLSVLAELQRELIVANTRDGLAAARARGRAGGRRPKLTPDQAALAQQLYDAGDKTVAQIAAIFKVPGRRCTGTWTSKPSAAAREGARRQVTPRRCRRRHLGRAVAASRRPARRW